jgi:ABC-type polysaccharide/polyol phosphate export permease
MSRQRLFLLRELAKRDFQARYAGSMLGLVWSFFQPIWQLLLFTFVFATVLKIPMTGQRTDNFAIFLFCGLLPWTAFQEGVQRSTTAITDNAALVSKLSFPSQLLVVAVVLTALVHEVVAGVVFVAILAVTGHLGWGGLPWLLLAVPIQLALTLGLALALSAVHVFFRDVAQLLGMLFMGWFYATPIVYPLNMVPAPYDRWLAINPLTTLVDLYRAALLSDGSPQAAGSIAAIAILAAVALTVLVVGWWIFDRLRPAFVDEV